MLRLVFPLFAGSCEAFESLRVMASSRFAIGGFRPPPGRLPPRCFLVGVESVSDFRRWNRRVCCSACMFIASENAANLTGGACKLSIINLLLWNPWSIRRCTDAHRIFSRYGLGGARDVGKPCFGVIVFFANCARWSNSAAQSMRTLFLEDTHFSQLTCRGAVSIRCEGGVRVCVRPARSFTKLVLQ